MCPLTTLLECTRVCRTQRVICSQEHTNNEVSMESDKLFLFIRDKNTSTFYTKVHHLLQKAHVFIVHARKVTSDSLGNT